MISRPERRRGVNDQELTLTVQQAQRYPSLQASRNGLSTNQHVASAPGLSVRQVQRINAKNRAGGCEAVRHGTRTKRAKT